MESKKLSTLAYELIKANIFSEYNNYKILITDHKVKHLLGLLFNIEFLLKNFISIIDVADLDSIEGYIPYECTIFISPQGIEEFFRKYKNKINSFKIEIFLTNMNTPLSFFNYCASNDSLKQVNKFLELPLDFNLLFDNFYFSLLKKEIRLFNGPSIFIKNSFRGQNEVNLAYNTILSIISLIDDKSVIKYNYIGTEKTSSQLLYIKDTLSKNYYENKNDTCIDLILIDRKSDLYTPNKFSWMYLSLIYDYLDVRDNYVYIRDNRYQLFEKSDIYLNYLIKKDFGYLCTCDLSKLSFELNELELISKQNRDRLIYKHDLFIREIANILTDSDNIIDNINDINKMKVYNILNNPLISKNTKDRLTYLKMLSDVNNNDFFKKNEFSDIKGSINDSITKKALEILSRKYKEKSTSVIIYFMGGVSVNDYTTIPDVLINSFLNIYIGGSHLITYKDIINLN